ncbi:uncharacterized protein C4orf51 homolog isoform 5-T5 [Thomomys bottae]
MSHFFYLSPEILVPFSPLTSQEFELIRSKARASWQDESRWSRSCVTTYSGSYREKQLDESKWSRCSPNVSQHEPRKNRLSLLSVSEHLPSPNQFYFQNTKGVKELHPGLIRTSLKNPADVKHSVVHQIWGTGHIDPSSYAISVSRLPRLEIQTDYKCGMKSFLKHVGTHSWEGSIGQFLKEC